MTESNFAARLARAMHDHDSLVCVGLAALAVILVAG